MNFYRFLIFLNLLLPLLLQCQTEKTEKVAADIKEFNWGTSTNSIIEKGFYHSLKSLDTTTNQLIGDTLIPIITFDSKIIIEKLEPLQMELRTVGGVDDFYITKAGFKLDTFIYDVKKYFGMTFLILISESSSSHTYMLRDSNIDLLESSNINFPEFSIENYAVGDEIDREDIVVLSKDQFGNTLTEQATLKKNENVLIKIIAGQFIEEMQWININKRQSSDIVTQLNNIFTTTPDIEYYSRENQNESKDIRYYYWSENEISILLTRDTEFGDLDDVWSLTYTNLIISNILNNYIDQIQEPL
jgi:hypothetical protein